MVKSILISNLSIEDLGELIRQSIRTELESLTPMVPDESKKYLTRKETAEKLRICLPTLNTYTKKGILQGKRVGSRVLYLEGEVTEAVKMLPYGKRNIIPNSISKANYRPDRYIKQ